METYFDIDPASYQGLPLCNVKECLKQNLCYCMGDLNDITPNSNKCERIVLSACQEYSEYMN